MNALGALGVLALLPAPPSPIRRIHVSRAGDFGAVRLEAADSGREAFGGVVSARELGLALERRLAALADLRVLRPRDTSPASAQHEDRVELQLQPGEAMHARQRARCWSPPTARVRSRAQALGIGVEEHDYGQTLFVCSLATDRAADGTAYERFTDQGPVALLPMGARLRRDLRGARTPMPTRVAALDDARLRRLFPAALRLARRPHRAASASAAPIPIARVLAERTRRRGARCWSATPRRPSIRSARRVSTSACAMR